MSIVDFLVSPFSDYAFMRRALATAAILSLGGAPLGVFMMLRRMTLVGDALAHAILPGVAIAFLVAGFSLTAMTIGGLVAAVLVALGAVFLVRATQLKEDAAFTLLYLLSLAIGVTLLSLKGSSVDLLHLLFGNILAVDSAALLLVTGASCFSLFAVAGFYRRLVVEGFDPDFLSVMDRSKRTASGMQLLFFVLLMINLVAAFQALGTLMALGLMMLPALAARFWTRNIDRIIPLAMGIALLSAYAGLLVSFHFGVPSGPAIVLVASAAALLSAFLGRVGSARVYGRDGV